VKPEKQGKAKVMNYNKYGLFYEKSAKKQAKINIEIDMQHAWGACGRRFKSCRPDS